MNPIDKYFARRLSRKQTRWQDIPNPSTWSPPDENDETIWNGTPYWGEGSLRNLNDPQAQVDAYRSWPYICIDRNSSAISSQTLRLYQQKGKQVPFALGRRAITEPQMKHLRSRKHLERYMVKAEDFEEVTAHPFLAMMRNVNSIFNEADMWKLTETYMGLTGNCFWLPLIDKRNEPIGLWVLEAHKTKVVLGSTLKDYIKAYVYRTRGGMDLVFNVEEVVHHKYPNPHEPAVGMAPTLALADSVEVNQEIYVYEKATFRNMARPDGVLQQDPDRPLNVEAYDRLKEQWMQTYRGAGNAGRVALLEPGVEYQAISFPPKDLAHLEGRKLTREEIAAGYGVPMALLSPIGANKAISQVAYKQYMRDTVAPKLKLYEQKINEQLIPLYEGGESMFVAFDNPVPEDREFELKELEMKLKTGYTAINLEREKAGEDTVEWGDEPILPNTMSPLSDRPEPTPPGAGFPPGGPQQEEPEEEPKALDYDLLAEKVADRLLEEHGIY